MAQTVTLKDIARKTNLSIASVSKALAGYPHVSKATQARVRAASSKLNYRPRTQRNANHLKHRVKCLATNEGLMQSGQWLAALAMASRSCGVRLEVGVIAGASSPADDGVSSGSKLQNWQKAIVESSLQADGILLFGCFTREEIQALETVKLPCVVVGDMTLQGNHFSTPIHSVTTSKVAMAQTATLALRERGHERIGFFCGSYPKGGWNEQWLHGYQLALRQTGIEPVEKYCQIIDTPHRSDIGAIAAQSMHALSELPTAYVTPTVPGARRFRQTMQSLGHCVDDQTLAMGGRRDDAVTLGMEDVLLIVEPVEELAIHAVSLLSRVISDNTLPSSQVVVPFQILNRDI